MLCHCYSVRPSVCLSLHYSISAYQPISVYVSLSLSLSLSTTQEPYKSPPTCLSLPMCFYLSLFLSLSPQPSQHIPTRGPRVPQVAEMVAGDCQDLYDLGRNATGVYHLPRHGRNVLCEMEGGDGGWLVVQRRASVPVKVSYKGKYVNGC